MKMQFDSMRVPFSMLRGDVRWTGEYVLLLPLDREGKLLPYGEQFGGYRNTAGRKVYLDDQPAPHQGNKERIRRLVQQDMNYYGLT